MVNTLRTVAKHKAQGRCLRKIRKIVNGHPVTYLCQKKKGHLLGCK